MKLYSIRNIWTGKFLKHFEVRFDKAPAKDVEFAQWGGTPTYWRRPDTISSHLQKIASTVDVELALSSTSALTSVWGGNYSYARYGFDRKKLEMIEVVVTTVSVLGEESFTPAHFLPAEFAEAA